MKITIVTVCYNAENDIEKTMNSVLLQTYQDVEYLIIDGRSSDKTVEIARKVIRSFPKSNSKLISEPDNGIFDAMNKGICLAHGEYINFMNAGDVFYNNDTLENIFSGNTIGDYDVIFGNQYLADGRKKMMKPFIYKANGYMNMGICHQCIFVKTDLARKYPFDTNFKIAADYNMIHTLYVLGYKFKDTHLPISIYDTTGYSAQNRLRQVDETAKICGVYGKWEHKVWKVFTECKLFVKGVLKIWMCVRFF